MPERTFSCFMNGGMCMGDPLCPDIDCQAHPALTCTTCTGGTCVTPQACRLPVAEIRPIRRHLFTQRRRRFDIRLPATREQWGFVVMTTVGIAGMAFILGAVGRHLGVF